MDAGAIEQHFKWQQKHFVWLVEKWFHCWNCHKKVKLLPMQQGKDPSVASPAPCQTVSCRFPTKVMCMGVVDRLCPEHNFDGKIDLTRVAEERTHEKMKHLDNAFLHEVDANKAVHHE